MATGLQPENDKTTWICLKMSRPATPVKTPRQHAQLFDLNPTPVLLQRGGAGQIKQIPGGAGGLILHHTDGRNAALKGEALLFPTAANTRDHSLPQSVIRN